MSRSAHPEGWLPFDDLVEQLSRRDSIGVEHRVRLQTLLSRLSVSAHLGVWKLLARSSPRTPASRTFSIARSDCYPWLRHEGHGERYLEPGLTRLPRKDLPLGRISPGSGRCWTGGRIAVAVWGHLRPASPRMKAPRRPVPICRTPPSPGNDAHPGSRHGPPNRVHVDRYRWSLLLWFAWEWYRP